MTVHYFTRATSHIVHSAHCVVSQEELEQRLLEQMNEKLRATEEQLRLEITRKVNTYTM